MNIKYLFISILAASSMSYCVENETEKTSSEFIDSMLLNLEGLGNEIAEREKKIASLEEIGTDLLEKYLALKKEELEQKNLDQESFVQEMNAILESIQKDLYNSAPLCANSTVRCRFIESSKRTADDYYALLRFNRARCFAERILLAKVVGLWERYFDRLKNCLHINYRN